MPSYVYVWLSHPQVTVAYSLSFSSTTMLCSTEKALQALLSDSFFTIQQS